ncbi:uncharacterized protein LOC135441052 isoform X2 [Drosophila montana]|uniref:uncharacterized protein LOC135441052 isoform X2 n=1 Tax=Drosophila montana TaxID=40370 RepID=UPI00313DBE9D
MSSPCGKCNTCPCGQSNQAPRQQPPPQQEQEIQQLTAPQQCQQIQHHESGYVQPQQGVRSRVECHCVTSKSNRRNTAPVQAPLADSYTCSRPRNQPEAVVVPIEERCTCKAKLAPPQCECSPAVVPPPSQQQLALDREKAETQQGTHAYITCGQATPYRNQAQPHAQYTNQQTRAPCSHCRTQKKKKCSIQ